MVKKRTKKIPQNYMDVVMFCNPGFKWSENEEGLVTIDVINKGLHHKIAQKFFHKPEISHIALDNMALSSGNQLMEEILFMIY